MLSRCLYTLVRVQAFTLIHASLRDAWEAGPCKDTCGSPKLQGAGVCGPELPHSTRAWFPWDLLCTSICPVFPSTPHVGLVSVPGLQAQPKGWKGRQGSKKQRKEKWKEERERKEIKAGLATDLYTFFPAGPFEASSLPEDFSWGEPERLGNSLTPTSPSDLLDLKQLRETFLTLASLI